jgi:hypothetical protein
MNRFLKITGVLLFSVALSLQADILNSISQKQKKVAREVQYLEQLLKKSSLIAKRVYHHKGKKYTVIGKDASGLFCKISPGKTKLIAWKTLPSNLLAAYRPDLAQLRLTDLKDTQKKIDQEYVFAQQQITNGLVFSDGDWGVPEPELVAVDREPETARGTAGTAASNEFSVFNVRFGMTPFEVMEAWPEAKPAETTDGYSTLEYRNKDQKILLASYLSEEGMVIMIMVAFEDLTATKRDSIIETLDEKYTRIRSEEDGDNPYNATYVYYPSESIILVAKTRQSGMGHVTVCTYGHIDKYKKNEAQQKKIMKGALKTLL